MAIEIDYKYLQEILRRKEGEIPNPQLARWAESLSRLKFEVRHIKGESNTIADFFSGPIRTFLMASSKTLPIGWHMEKCSFIYNLPRFISALSLDIKEKIFEKVVDYHEYPKSSKDTVWRLSSLL